MGKMFDMRQVLAFVGLLAAMGIHKLWGNVKLSLSYHKDLSFNNTNCKLLEVPTMVEDLSVYDHHCAFGGGGDIWTTFQRGSAAASQGGLWLVNATKGSIQE